MSMKQLVNTFNHRYEQFRQRRLITPEMFQRYDIANDESLHSRVQTVLLLAGYDAGLAAFPEVRLRLREPLDKGAIDTCYIAKSRRYQRTFTVDIGFYDGTQLCGIGEVFTLDMAHAAAPDLPGVTPYHKLRHLARELTGFMVLVLVLPHDVQHAPIWDTWKGWHKRNAQARQATLEKLVNQWSDLVAELRGMFGREATCLRVTEDSVEELS